MKPSRIVLFVFIGLILLAGTFPAGWYSDGRCLAVPVDRHFQG